MNRRTFMNVCRFFIVYSKEPRMMGVCNAFFFPVNCMLKFVRGL